MTDCAGCGSPLPPSKGTKPRKWCNDDCRRRFQARGSDSSTPTDLDEVLRLLAGAARGGSVTAMNTLLRYHTMIEARSSVPDAPVGRDQEPGDGFDVLDGADELSRRRAA
jgi:hypothetical protein